MKKLLSCEFNIEELTKNFVAMNGTAGVDAVSGATMTSKALFEAVNDCLAQAAL